MSEIDLSIVIVNYNTFEVTCNCIKSILTNTNSVVFEILLVDNNSTDVDPSEFLKLFPEIRLIANNDNVGFSIANNQGMEASGGKFILLINSDTYLINNAIDKAYEFALNHSDIKIFGANILNVDLTPQKSFFYSTSTSWLSSFKYGFIYANPLLSKFFKPKENIEKVGGLYGAYVFLSREVYDQTKGFDPDFFMYCEDTEWFRNRLSENYKIKICSEAKIVHIGGQSDKVNHFVNGQNVLSYFLYWYKLGKLKFFIYTTGAYLNTFITFFLLPLMSNMERKRHLSIILIRLKLFGKIVFNITKYKNEFGSRPTPLRFQK